MSETEAEGITVTIRRSEVTINDTFNQMHWKKIILREIGKFHDFLVKTQPSARVVVKFLCAGCNACFVGETTGYFSTRVRAPRVEMCAPLS